MRKFVPVVPILLACGGAFSPEPEEGDYSVTTSNVTTTAPCDDWGLSISVAGPERIAVQVTDEQILFLGFFDCDRDGPAGFECVVEETVPVADDFDLVARLDGSGDWVKKDLFEASFDQVLVCEGSACDGFEDPCTVSYDWVGELVE